MADDSTGRAKATVSLVLEVASSRADCWGSSLERSCFRRVRSPREEEAAQDMGCPYKGAAEGARAIDPGLTDKSIPKGRLSSAIHHVQEAVGTNELNQLKGAFWLKGSPLPWPQYLPQEGIQFRDFSGGPVVKNLPSSNTEDSIPG